MSLTLSEIVNRETSFLMRCVAKLTNQRPVLMKLRQRKNNIIADKNRRNFFENFSWIFPRSTDQEASIELSFVIFGSVGASEVHIHSKKKTRQNKMFSTLRIFFKKF